MRGRSESTPTFAPFHLSAHVLVVPLDAAGTITGANAMVGVAARGASGEGMSTTRPNSVQHPSQTMLFALLNLAQLLYSDTSTVIFHE